MCRQSDPDAWYPETPELWGWAKKVCKSCPVIRECLDYAIENNEHHGIWGGMNQHERRRERRKRNKDTA